MRCARGISSPSFSTASTRSRRSRTRAAAAASGTIDQALLLIEPDNFKQVLDGVGLGNADVLLGDMAGLMRRHLGESDIAGRIGEHTFGVLVTKRSVDDTRQLAEKLRKAFEERIFDIGKQSISLTVSIGGSADRREERERADAARARRRARCAPRRPKAATASTSSIRPRRTRRPRKRPSTGSR